MRICWRRSTAGGLRGRDVEILEQALLCGVRKTVAVDVGLSCSSIAVILQSCFTFMGLDCLPSRIPGLVVAAAHARRHPGTPGGAFLKAPPGRESMRHTITVSRPDVALGRGDADAARAALDDTVPQSRLHGAPRATRSRR